MPRVEAELGTEATQGAGIKVEDELGDWALVIGFRD
jgi:hypothetical protein